MIAKDMREMSVEDLQSKSVDLAEELNKLRFQHGIRPLENTSRLHELKKDISRCKTVMTEKLRA